MLTWWLLDDFRFFVLNNESGLLEYFVNEQSRPQKPRGMLPLAGAVISPSDEDSHTFTVNAISGEQYKLRGGCYLPANIHVTRQPYRQASTLTAVHQMYSVLISLLWWHSGIHAASGCPFARVISFSRSSFFVFVSQPLMPKRGNTGWADCRSAHSTTQRPWARYDGVCWMFSWGHIYSWAQCPLLIPSLSFFCCSQFHFVLTV